MPLGGIPEVLVAEVGGGLVDGQREQPIGMSGGNGERAGAPARMAVEVEAFKPLVPAPSGRAQRSYAVIRRVRRAG